jgi:hypothetical protein
MDIGDKTLLVLATDQLLHALLFGTHTLAPYMSATRSAPALRQGAKTRHCPDYRLFFPEIHWVTFRIILD